MNKRARHTRTQIKCSECNKTMNLEFWKKTHCKNVHPNIKNPKYTYPDNESIINLFFCKKEKGKCYEF